MMKAMKRACSKINGFVGTFLSRIKSRFYFSVLTQRHITSSRAGRQAGHLDGKVLGVQKGFEIGHEIGFYSGCVQIWRQLGVKHPEFITARADKAIAALEEMLRSFPLDNPRVSYIILSHLMFFSSHVYSYFMHYTQFMVVFQKN